MSRLTSLLLSLAVAATAGPALAATYQYTSPTYMAVLNHTPPCDPSATCQDFAPTGNTTGWFSTATPLPPSFSGYVSAQLTGYNFTDGLHTYSSSDPASRVIVLQAFTDAAGQLTNAHISLQRWADGGAGPHASNDWFHSLYLNSATGNVLVDHNNRCDTLSSLSVPDACVSTLASAASKSSAWTGSPGTWTTNLASTIPTLSEWGMAVLALLLGTVGWRRMTRRGRPTPN